jgi:squalene-hopene/tetraprenyl-beta-curcumene cyclase
MALWASPSRAPILTEEERKAVVDAALAAQRADGGWSTASLGDWKRHDGTALDTRSDGYATGLAVVALRQSGGAGCDSAITKGIAWLKANQDRATGQWLASSLNKERDPASDPGKFMTDAATGLAALALAGK